MPRNKITNTIVIFILVGFGFNTKVNASIAEFKITTVVDTPKEEWVKVFDNNTFYIANGKIIRIDHSGFPNYTTFSDEEVRVWDSVSKEQTIFQNKLFDPEILADYVNLQQIYTLFLKDTKWIQYDEGVFESAEPVVICTDDGIKRLKVWMFMLLDDPYVNKITLIDENDVMHDIQFIYEASSPYDSIDT